MDLQYELPNYLSFNWDQMEEQISANGDKECNSSEEIVEYLREYGTPGYHVIGHISTETAKKWKDWNSGKLWVVSVNGTPSYFLCTEIGGIVV